MKRQIQILGDIGIVPLTLGLSAIIDAEDIELCSQYTWHAAKRRGRFYAATNVRKPDGTKTIAFMHRLLLAPRDGMLTDHRDGDGLNNRRGNLREATNSQNQMNHPPRKGTRSGLKGVSFHNPMRKWRARISVQKKEIVLGYFETKADAHAAYRAGSAKYHGDFGRAV